MFQVIQTKGEYEPWWFFDDWKTMVVSEYEYTDFKEALVNYKRIFEELMLTFPHSHTKKPYVSAFWSEEEIEYCDTCADDVQIYHGVLLLEDEKIIST